MLSEKEFCFLLKISAFFKPFKQFGKLKLCGSPSSSLLSSVFVILLWELCKGKINVRTFGFAAQIVTGDLQDTDCALMLVVYSTIH